MRNIQHLWRIVLLSDGKWLKTMSSLCSWLVCCEGKPILSLPFIKTLLCIPPSPPSWGFWGSGIDLPNNIYRNFCGTGLGRKIIIFLNVSVKVLVVQLCPTLCDPMDCSSPGSSVQGILQAWILEWVGIPSSRKSSRHRDWTCVSHIQADSLPSEPSGKPFKCWMLQYSSLSVILNRL